MTRATPNGHKAAFEKWFLASEKERKRRHITAGRKVPGFETPPPGPDELRYLIDYAPRKLSERTMAELCGVHRTTVLRWLDGSVQIPAAAYAMLRFHAEGVPPGCGDAWRGFSWSGDTLTTPDGRTTLTAHEIAGRTYQDNYTRALEDRLAKLEQQLQDMTRRIDWGSANDPYTNPADIRARAFQSP